MKLTKPGQLRSFAAYPPSDSSTSDSTGAMTSNPSADLSGISQGKVPTKHVRLAVAFKTAEHYYALVGPVSFASMDDLTVFTSCIDWMQEAEG